MKPARNVPVSQINIQRGIDDFLSAQKPLNLDTVATTTASVDASVFPVQMAIVDVTSVCSRTSPAPALSRTLPRKANVGGQALAVMDGAMQRDRGGRGRAPVLVHLGGLPKGR